MVTGEYHNILMAFYIHVSCLHVLHTQVNHILLRNGNKNTDGEYETRQHFE